jgi:hypothetical protein
MKANTEPQPPKPQLTPLQANVELLRRGHREVLPRMKQQLREQPEIWRYVGDLAAQSRRAWIELAGGQNDLLKESVALYAEERVQQIAGEHPTPLETILAERIVAHEMRALYMEALDAQNVNAEGTPIAEFRLQKQETADRQLGRAIKLLADVRAMLSRTVSIEVKMTNNNDHHEPRMNGKSTVDEPRDRHGKLGVNRINGRCNGHAVLNS